jgi:hypothetical protein
MINGAAAPPQIVPSTCCSVNLLLSTLTSNGKTGTLPFKKKNRPTLEGFWDPWRQAFPGTLSATNGGRNDSKIFP